MPDPKNGAKSAEKIPALIVFGRIRGSNLSQTAVFLEKDCEVATKGAPDAGLSSLDVQTEDIDAPRPLCPKPLSTCRDGSRCRPLRQQ